MDGRTPAEGSTLAAIERLWAGRARRPSRPQSQSVRDFSYLSAATWAINLCGALLRRARSRRCTIECLLLAKRSWIDRGEPAHDGERRDLGLRRKPAFDCRQVRIELGGHPLHS